MHSLYVILTSDGVEDNNGRSQSEYRCVISQFLFTSRLLVRFVNNFEMKSQTAKKLLTFLGLEALGYNSVLK